LLEEFNDVFVTNLNQLGRSNLVQHKINTGDAQPIRQRAYRATIPDQEFIHEEIQRMLNAGIIQQSNSPWASPIVVASKKGNKKRFCVDYRKLNEVIQKDAYPLPRIDEMLDNLGDAT